MEEIINKLSHEDKKELSYLNLRNDIKEFVDKTGYQNIIKYMIDDLDNMDDINNTQSMHLFEIICSLEKVLEVYPRLDHV